MRTKYIKTSLEIPVPIDSPDENGVLYTEEAIINACKNADGLPIIIYNNDGTTTVVGVTNDVKYENGHILVNGILHFGGTHETVMFNDEKKIYSMEIMGFGISN